MEKLDEEIARQNKSRSDRIRKILENERHLTQTAIAEAIGITPQAVQGWLRTGQIGSHSLIKLARITGYRAEWIESGLGPSRSKLHQQAGSYVAEPKLTDEAVLPISNKVPLIGWADISSTFRFAELNLSSATLWVRCPVACSIQTFALEVKGDAMTSPHGRSYPEGAVIYVDPHNGDKARRGQRVVAIPESSERPVFREIAEDETGTNYLRTLNPTHPNLFGGYKVIGVVIAMFVPETPLR